MKLFLAIDRKGGTDLPVCESKIRVSQNPIYWEGLLRMPIKTV